MIGGDREAYEYLEEIFQAISEKDGCLYTGKIWQWAFHENDS